MPTQIDPQYRSRFSFEEIRSAYPTPEDAWTAGDFVFVSETAGEDSELRACATIMAGFVVQGLERLERFVALSPRGLLIGAFALWQLDRTSEADAMISRIPSGSTESDMAMRLRRLMGASEIRVLATAAVMPLFTQGDDSARQPVYRYGQFKLSYYATQLGKNAWANGLNDPFDEFVSGLDMGEKPDFIFTLTPQWPLPRNFAGVDVPRVIWCHDTDIFFNRGADNLALHDVRLTCTSQEHFELRHALGRPCISSILTETMCMPGPKPVLAVEKDVDVLFTGAALNVLHSEKPRFLYQLAGLSPQYRIRIVDGHISESEYFDLVARSRFVPIINRYSGQPSPRWLDALGHSSCVLYPRGSGYATVGFGCFAYRESDIAADISGHIEAHRAAKLGSPYHPVTVYENMNRYFAVRQISREKNIERLLKFAAFSALVWRVQTSHAEPGTPKKLRQRSVWYTPPIDLVMFRKDNLGKKIEKFADGLRPDSGWDDRDYNNAAAISMHLAVLCGDTFRGSRRRRALALLDQGLERFPNSLLLWFNAAHWRFFQDRETAFAADRRFAQLITKFDVLEFSWRDSDVGLPVTFYQRDPIFPYYDYCQLVLSWEVRKGRAIFGDDKSCSATPADVLLAAAHGYLGLSAERRANLRSAIDHYERSLAIYSDNLPVMRTRLAALCRLAQMSDFEPRLGEDILQAFVECASKDPAVLFSTLHWVVPALDRAGRRDAIKDLLAMWYRFASVTYFGSPNWFADAIEGFVALNRFESLFPDDLRTRLAQLRGDPAERASASQFEVLIAAGANFNTLSLINLKAGRALRRVGNDFARIRTLYGRGGWARMMSTIARRAIGR